ncbi:hypothetical protein A8C56_09045 [Niabella ginsenosidivorans]|uniref:NADPH-dependent FMN reductase-like domain-containing protein n=1 Tax=Niabella ginsenosidivorans TaxID=1176587 RepID=A0A1A9I0F5_9BACT|nr:NADPH-dependent FMN reductase [Niabella ginsenosidivorans]ANH81106.1 hypothetical protein A8C56_09045 [Niabella ginsenosidivorans]
MKQKIKILAVIGSASPHSSNLSLVKRLQQLNDEWELSIWEDLSVLPHFDPEQAAGDSPASVLQIRKAVANADGIIISTPEYIFSIPARLKNMLEWCVATTVFEQKPSGIITASASGAKGHSELQLIMQTLGARFTQETCLLIRGVKGKISEDGIIKDPALEEDLQKFSRALQSLIVPAAGTP